MILYDTKYYFSYILRENECKKINNKVFINLFKQKHAPINYDDSDETIEMPL